MEDYIHWRLQVQFFCKYKTIILHAMASLILQVNLQSLVIESFALTLHALYNNIIVKSI